jgi:peptidoglycan/LPS O-acetylase OafA/YrhL
VPPAPHNTEHRLAALDGLRFIAALMVVVFHLVACLSIWEFWNRPHLDVFGSVAFQVTSYGWVGVPLFFMTSGFVISMSSWGRTPGQFAVSRFVRLYPAYWVCVTATVVVVALSPSWPKPEYEWRDVLTNYTMLNIPLGVPNVDDVYWTLWAEMRFYLLFAIVIWRGLTYRSALTFCIVWTAASVWAAGVDSPLLQSLLVNEAQEAHYFIAGIALFLIYKFGSHLAPWLLVGVSALISVHYYEGNYFNGWVGLSYLPSTVAILACYAVLSLLALGKLRWLRWRGLTVLGATTYPLYLLHNIIGGQVIAYLYPRARLQPWALVSLVIVGLVIAAWLVHRLVERPFAPRLKRALSRAIGGQAPATPAPAAPAPVSAPPAPAAVKGAAPADAEGGRQVLAHPAVRLEEPTQA